MFDERAELLDVYRGTPLTLRALLRDVNGDLLRQRPAEDEWSILEIVAHLGDTEERAFARVRHMLKEDLPTLEGYDQAALAEERDYRSMDYGDALDRFEQLRAEQAAFLEKLDVAAWQRAGDHTEVGQITIQQMTAHMAAHDSVHLAQISRILLA